LGEPHSVGIFVPDIGDRSIAKHGEQRLVQDLHSFAMTSFSSSLPLPHCSSALALSVSNNHVPPDSIPPDAGSYPLLTTRQSLLEELSETESAIRQLEVSTLEMYSVSYSQERLVHVYFHNALFARENEGLQNLNEGVDWFTTVRQQATQNEQALIVYLSFIYFS
jgi:hypothetical protein